MWVSLRVIKRNYNLCTNNEQAERLRNRKKDKKKERKKKEKRNKRKKERNKQTSGKRRIISVF
jgi:hypothetical protein